MSRLANAMAGTAGREVTAYDRFRAQVNLVRTDIASLVGEKNVDKFVRVSLNAVQANPKVLTADRRSLFLAVMKAAQDGLLPDGREAALNIYSTKVKDGGAERWVDTVQYLPMAYGLVQKIYEAGATYVDAVAVYDKDVFEYQRGDEPKVVHKPYDGIEDPGDVKAAYVIVKLRTGETKREVMFRRDIERVRSKSKAKDGLMWKDFYDQAAIKSVIHRVVKQLPRSESLDTAVSHDNEATGLEDIPIADATGVNLEALVDGRLEQQLRDAAMPPKQEKVVEPAAKAEAAEDLGRLHRGAGPAEVATEGSGTPERRDEILAKMRAAKTIEELDVALVEADFLAWTKPDRAAVDIAYTESKQALTKEIRK